MFVGTLIETGAIITFHIPRFLDRCDDYTSFRSRKTFRKTLYKSVIDNWYCLWSKILTTVTFARKFIFNLPRQRCLQKNLVLYLCKSFLTLKVKFDRLTNETFRT